VAEVTAMGARPAEALVGTPAVTGVARGDAAGGGVEKGHP
jgi:hypothetical protein